MKWQQVLSTSTYNWPDAKTYCAGLSLGGTGWRLPTLIELESIVDYGTTAPTIDTVAFPNTSSTEFWSSSPFAASTGYAWVVDFYAGYTAGYDMARSYQVRCVRCAGGPCAVAAGGVPGAPPGRYAVSTDTVVDTQTALTWQRKGPAPTYAWADATTYCQVLNLGGTGWRLPTLKELQSLVDVRAVGGWAFDPVAFPNTPAFYFWSSSPYANSTIGAWLVNFAYGGTFYLNVTATVRVQCVR